MTRALVIVGVVLLVLGLIVATSKRRSRVPPSSAAGRASYLGLRNLMLGGSRAKFSLPATAQPTQPWGVVMDWDVSAGTATVVAMSDGSASIYLSSGGGSLGGIGQEPIRNAAKNAVRLAAEVQPQMKHTKTFPLPETGEVTFYALTDTGVLTATAQESDLRTGQSSFTQLGNAMQGVVTQYRLFQEREQGPKS